MMSSYKSVPRVLGVVFATLLPAAAPAQEMGSGRGAAMLTPPMTCYFDKVMLYGPYAVESGNYREFRFQLREDGILLVNGHEVKPLEVERDGTNSSVAIDVGAIVVEPKEAAMLQLLPPDQKQVFQEMASRRGLAMTGGVIRIIRISFSDQSVILSSVKGDEVVDKASDRCS